MVGAAGVGVVITVVVDGLAVLVVSPGVAVDDVAKELVVSILLGVALVLVACVARAESDDASSGLEHDCRTAAKPTMTTTKTLRINAVSEWPIYRSGRPSCRLASSSPPSISSSFPVINAPAGDAR